MSEETTDAMDLSKVENHISELESSINQVLENTRKSVKIAGVVAAVIPLVLLLYFIFIFNQIKKKPTAGDSYRNGSSDG